MTFDDAVDAIAHDTDGALDAVEWLLEHWESAVPRCRTLLRDYVSGSDLSERTERALAAIILLLAEREDTASFFHLCLLASNAELAESVLGEDGMVMVMPPALISTFDGDTTPLSRLVEDPSAGAVLRGDTLLVLAYLARTKRFPERKLYEYLAALPERLEPQEQDYVWFGWVRAVAAMGFAGLSGQAEQIFKRGLIDPALAEPVHFWAELRESQDDPGGMTSQAWDGIGPVGTALEWIQSMGAEADEPAQPPEPVRNPLRLVGRNDPCPCGSGRKYKKCCLDRVPTTA